jgi:hypothetical protein
MVEGYICDGCKEHIYDVMEIQEMILWRTTCGYNSIFGDGSKISMDLCQNCIKKYLGEFLFIETEPTLYTL